MCFKYAYVIWLNDLNSWKFCWQMVYHISVVFPHIVPLSQCPWMSTIVVHVRTVRKKLVVEFVNLINSLKWISSIN